MDKSIQSNNPQSRVGALYLGSAAVLLLFVFSGLISYLNTRTLRRDQELIAQTHDVLTALGDIMLIATDAETGQRGYLISGDERYLDPYNNAVQRIDGRFDDLLRLIQGEPERIELVERIRTRWGDKHRQLSIAIDQRRAGGIDAARDVIQSERGRTAMLALRSEVQDMQDAEKALRRLRIEEMERAYSGAIISGVVACAAGVILSAFVAYLLHRALRNRLRHEWLQSGEILLGQAIAGDQRIEQLGENVLRFFSEFTSAQVGALFVEQDGQFRRAATYGVPSENGTPERFELNDGLLAQAVKDRRKFILGEVPDGYLSLGSAFGHGKPRHLVISPVQFDGRVNGVIELGFMEPVTKSLAELLDRIDETIGVAIRSVHYQTHLQNLLEETQRQAEELQTQGEELRVSNEELEEQGRALRESQTRLEQQQAELEQTNAQLEEQTQLLESQRDEVARAKTSLEKQTNELERASQYKSDFLANMSHELRTPLNSSLILAKLLADNPAGNLTAEQVQYAETIQTAGNDLLMLINDILDLSKIEAGHMEVHPEHVTLESFLDDLARVFRPVAEHKGLQFHVVTAPGTPENMEFDRQRMEQVLKNLLSNAIKFTERGEVELSVRPAGKRRVAFAVRDTGIGIPPEQQELIFEAFRQADSTSNRKFGGTGLGLSISRELARLLGGEIQLSSQLGQGSTFTIIVPEVYDPALVKPWRPESPAARPQPVAPAMRAAPVASSAASRKVPVDGAVMSAPRRISDDRERLSGDRRVILAVEDDEPFARIIYDLAHELDFQCVIATSAEEGFAAAVQHLPSAVVLDVGLPDHSGLWVLDRLKHDRRTRHIPVHIISGSDFTDTALSLGAVGYLLKPVPREQLAEAFKQLETRLTQRLRRVLVVEDDPVQLDSLQKLLGSQDVETVGVATAAECLEQLKRNTFDCMVLDLSLPDASGYTLLETLSNEDTYSFPPVIVYTGRELSPNEEQRLRKYSKSIIIKGAKSPERLLDEVTLFLHQVVAKLPPEQQRMLEIARSRDATIEGRRILVVEDDVRNVFALTSVLEPRGAVVQIARNGREALDMLERSLQDHEPTIDLVLMDVMMPEMDGITAVREIRKRRELKRLPVIMLTAKAMKDDQETCIAAGANDYMAKPLDVEKLLSLVRVWMPR